MIKTTDWQHAEEVNCGVIRGINCSAAKGARRVQFRSSKIAESLVWSTIRALVSCFLLIIRLFQF